MAVLEVGNHQAKGNKYLVINPLDEDIKQFELELWPHDLKIIRGHLLSRGSKFSNYQAIEVFEYWAGNIFSKTSSLAFIFDSVAWKSIGVMGYPLFQI